MTQDEYIRCDATALAALVQAGEVTPDELIDVAVKRLEQVNPLINAVVYRMDEEARARTAGIDPGTTFAGVPFLAKDLQSNYAGHPTSGGSRLAADLVVDQDTELVRRVRATGVSILGKTNAPEFGLLPYTEPQLWGPCRNPWSLDRTPGGSSGGSGAADGRERVAGELARPVRVQERLGGDAAAGGEAEGGGLAAGQVFEWTASPGNPGRFLVKGGSWDDSGCGVCRPAARHGRPADIKHILVGFRLVREPGEGE